MNILNREITVDTDEIIEFIENEDFINYMLEHTEDISVPAFILQATYNELNRIKKEGNS
jgi:rRNA-processing protein FCF1